MGNGEEKPIKKDENNVKSFENEFYCDNEMIIEGSGEILNLINSNQIGKSACIIEYISNNFKKGNWIFNRIAYSEF